ncbi:AAA family ATPase [Nonlabens ulvanivorans]|uniref:AAA family ATPase n=1 Tax=Nonlabens ulvanivorans TaxID=906888 RepID=UPI002942C85D|nr:ATP-binding protein [Nonlabens ulvanivorans]WOI23645.1 ATP-binding protein [Nonlabens ulvanivorans]
MIHLIVGNTGSGKTTYSYQLKKKHKAIIFSIDKWNKELYLADKKPQDGLDWFLERIDRSEVIILDFIEQLESCNVDSILDLGLSKLEHRNKFRDFALSQGYEIKIHFLDIPKEIRWSRVSKRNIEKGNTYEFEVTKDNFEFMEEWFEAPSTIEMSDGILIKQ